MKLGKKGKDVETFVDKLVAEGESELFFVFLEVVTFTILLLPGVTSATAPRQPTAVAKAPSQAAHERWESVC